METENIPFTEQHLCNNCLAAIAAESRFCRHCGERQDAHETDDVDQRFAILKQLALFFGLEVLMCCLFAFIDYFKTLEWLVVFDVISAIATLSFFIFNWQHTQLALKWPSFSFKKLAAYTVIAIAGSVLVHYSVGWLNQTLFSDDIYYYTEFSGLKYGKVLMVLSIAVVPAIFEELAFRGYLLTMLMKAIDQKQAVFISGFLFAIIHLSFVSLFWLLPFGYLIGYMYVKEKTIWYGVFFHFFFNLTGCLLEMVDLNVLT